MPSFSQYLKFKIDSINKLNTTLCVLYFWISITLEMVLFVTFIIHSEGRSHEIDRETREKLVIFQIYNFLSRISSIPDITNLIKEIGFNLDVLTRLKHILVVLMVLGISSLKTCQLMSGWPFRLLWFQALSVIASVINRRVPNI